MGRDGCVYVREEEEEERAATPDASRVNGASACWYH